MSLKFGDRFVNPWASAENPQKVGYFVRTGTVPRGRMNAGAFCEFTDKAGTFWRMAKADVELALSGNVRDCDAALPPHTSREKVE